MSRIEKLNIGVALMRTKRLPGYCRLVALSLLFVKISIFSETLKAQEASSNQDTIDESVIATSAVEGDQTIDVSDLVSDRDIEERIGEILAASRWFNDTRVQVNEGIVIIEGATSFLDKVDWAESIALRTEGVIAVINRVDYKPESAWTLKPLIAQSALLKDRLANRLPAILLSLLTLVLTVLAYMLLTRLMHRILGRYITTRMLQRLIARVSMIPVLILGLYMVLNISGLGNLATTVIGGTGLIGLVVGIAFRDITENFLASILISIQRPFKLDDVIRVGDYLGVVKAVNTRGTVLATFEGNHVQIPNSKIYKESIINYTANPNVRLDFTVGIGYDAAISRAQDIVMDVLSSHPAVLGHPEPMVLAEALGSSTVNLRIYFWVNGTKHSNLKVRSAVIRIVKQTFLDKDISMPDDRREIIFPEGIKVMSEKNEKDFKGVDESTKVLHEKDGNADNTVMTKAEQKLTPETDMIKAQNRDLVLGESEENLI